MKLATWMSIDKQKVEKTWQQLCEYDYSPIFFETVQNGQLMYAVRCLVDDEMISRVDRYFKTEWESFNEPEDNKQLR